MNPYWIEAKGAHNLKTQVAIIGSGAGGAMVAMTLAEAGLDVILLEKGFHYDHTNTPKTLGETIGVFYEENFFRSSQGEPPLPVA